MSLMSALTTGVSGINANSQELGVVGDNIANSNTVGYKSSRAAFADAMAEQIVGAGGTSGAQRGLGSKMQTIQRIMTQGSLSNTGIATDLAIEGNGFFVVKGSHNGQVGNFYSRAGQFTIDRDGYLVNLEGLRVQGYSADANGTITTVALGDLKVGSASTAPKMTDAITVRANLQSDAPTPAAFDPVNPRTTSNFSTSISIYDSLGKPHQVDIYYRATGAGGWEWFALTDGGGTTGGTAGQNVQIGNGTLTFNPNGSLQDATGTAVTFNPLNATQNQAFTLNFGTTVASGGTGLDGVTQFAAPSAASFLSQNGYQAGDLSRVTFDSQGRAIGAFSNGQSRVLGQVALASFSAPDRLARTGSNLYAESVDSGVATIGTPATANRGSVMAGALEQSNVDLAAEFVRMIAAQRGFEANSKTVTTADQLLQELMALKR